MYSKIVNPKTKHKVSIYSKTGRLILHKYLRQIGKLIGGSSITNNRMLLLNENDILINDDSILKMIKKKHESSNGHLHYFTLNTESKELCIMLNHFENEMHRINTDISFKQGTPNRELLGRYFVQGPEFIFEKKYDTTSSMYIISIDMIQNDKVAWKFNEQPPLTVPEDIPRLGMAINQWYLYKNLFSSQLFVWNLARSLTYATKYLSNYKDIGNIKLLVRTDIVGSDHLRTKTTQWHKDGKDNITIGLYFTKEIEKPIIGLLIRTPSNRKNLQADYWDEDNEPHKAQPTDKIPLDGVGCERMIIFDNQEVLHRSHDQNEIRTLIEHNFNKSKLGGMLRFSATVMK